MRILIRTAIAAMLLSVGALPAIPASTLHPADSILVRKSERSLYLMREGTVIGRYRIALGLDPDGPKQREGDFRTPEGHYRLIRRNARSDFFLSIQISYPNERDIAHARRQGWEPGGQIMIHGAPNRPKYPAEYYEQRDWTDGCIAVTNSDMVEIWLRTTHDTPIEILP